MIDHRNLLSHTYDPVNFEEAVNAIYGRYLSALQQMHRLLAGELDDLPLPYRFEVQPMDRITHRPLRDHIDRVGIRIYQAA